MTCCCPASSLDLVDQKCNHNEDLKRAAVPLENGLFQSDFTIVDMHCAACIRKLETGFDAVAGIQSVRANLSLKRLSLVWDKQLISPEEIENMIQSFGFSANPYDLSALSDKQDKQSKQLLLALGVAGFSAMNIMLLSVSVWSGTDIETTHLFHLISGVIAVPAVFFAGQPFFKAAFSALKVGRLNMEVPISLAVLLTLGMSVFESLNGGDEAYFDAAVSLLFFLLIGRYLDHLMRRRARVAVDQLSNIAAKGATVRDSAGRLTYHTLDAIKPKDHIIVKPGERIPLDCRLLSDRALLDRSLVTGECVPAYLEVGEEIEAGTLNLEYTVELEVLRSEDKSFVAEIVRLMEAAEGSRSKYIRIADRMAQIYAPAVHLLALITFIGWFAVSGDWHISLYTAIAVLIVTCPCALGLAVPVVHVIAATRLFQKGIMMKDGSALERAAEVDTVFFDKTGTLTHGMSDAVHMDGDLDLLPIAKALAQSSSHPKAAAIAYGLRDIPSSHPNLSVKEITGEGVEWQTDTKTVRLGRADWVRDINPNAGEGDVVCADSTGRYLIFEVGEKLRKGSTETIDRLRTKGLEITLISGDTNTRVIEMAKAAHIKTVLSDQRPQDKIDAIKQATAKGSRVMMVGDGLNDAAALSEGHASMAPSSACDVGKMAADFVFTRDTLEAVPDTLAIARKAASLVKQNFALALLYNCIAVPCAMAGLVTPLFAAIAMSLSSIIVVANSMRLSIKKPIAIQSATTTLAARRIQPA